MEIETKAVEVNNGFVNVELYVAFDTGVGRIHELQRWKADNSGMVYHIAVGGSVSFPFDQMRKDLECVLATWKQIAE